MHIVILGCGRVGSALAHTLDDEGHSVAVIDLDEAPFRRLGEHFGGVTIRGVGFDRDTLVEAGIERAHAFAAVSSGDNTNILAARVARETYGVENVVARIYDPKRAEVYERLGIPTVATVSWSTGQIMRRLLPMGAQEEWRDPTGTIVLAEIHAAPEWIGRRLTALEEAAGCRIAAVTRYGQAVLTQSDTVLQEGDLAHVLFRSEDRDRVEAAFVTAPEVHN